MARAHAASVADSKSRLLRIRAPIDEARLVRLDWRAAGLPSSLPELGDHAVHLLRLSEVPQSAGFVGDRASSLGSVEVGLRGRHDVSLEQTFNFGAGAVCGVTFELACIGDKNSPEYDAGRFLSYVGGGTGAARGLVGIGKAGLRRGGRGAAGGADEGTEVVQRAMSRAELEATQRTGLVRGGRPGTHYVSDNVNTSALRARQRLALPQTPELQVYMRVPQNVFSSPTRIPPRFQMPGGGLQRSAQGRVPCQVVRVRSYC